MSFISVQARQYSSRLAEIIRQSSRAQRIEALAPFFVAIVFTSAVIALRVFLFDDSPDHLISESLSVFSILAVFFAGITWITSPLVEILISRHQEKRVIDVLWIGLYLPQALITLIILYSQITASDTITDLSAAIITWAMFSLILTPFSIILTFLAWSFLPKELLDLRLFKKRSLRTRILPHKGTDPISEVLQQISDTPEPKPEQESLPLPTAKNENKKSDFVDMSSRLSRVGQSRP